MVGAMSVGNSSQAVHRVLEKASVAIFCTQEQQKRKLCSFLLQELSIGP